MGYQAALTNFRFLASSVQSTSEVVSKLDDLSTR